MKSRRGIIVATLFVSFVFLAALNALSNVGVRGVALDLTQDKTFTLSEGTFKTLREMQEPVTLRFFYSTKLGETVPTYGAYAARVRALLERYAALSRGKIRLEILNPAPFSEDEDRAVAFGVQAVPVDQSGEQVFFGLVGTNTVDESDKIAFFHPSREPFIEYDLTRLIRNLSNAKKKVVGIVTSLPLQGQFSPGGMQPPWPIYNEIGGVFETKMISDEKIPDDVDVLLIAHPAGLDDKVLFAIDQYVLRGGKAVVLVDPVPESAPRRRTMFGGGMVGPGSDLPKLFKQWGIELKAERVATDADRALRVNAAGEGGRAVAARYVAWLDLRAGTGPANNINRSDPVTAGLNQVIMASSGIIVAAKDATTKITPLLFTTATGSETDANKLRMQPDVLALLREYQPGKEQLSLAVRVTGKVKSAFPDGAPKPKEEPKKEEAKKDEPAKEGEKKDEPKKEEPKAPEALKESKGDIDVIVVADVDFLQEQFWAREQNFFGETVRIPYTGNADFLMFALDQLSGANALKGLRGKGIAARPFTKVEQMQADAEKRLRAQRADLEKRYKEIQDKLKDVRTKGSDGKIELTAEQQAAVVQFTRELLRIRREQRAVQFEARRDYEAMDRTLKLANIGAVPVVVGLIALVVGFVRYQRRRRRYETS
ncbi:MAG: GldG family protein [Candidatus Odyssella sp.]|nr:GldG family protein [Candidatus Odyssella sp.]